ISTNQATTAQGGGVLLLGFPGTPTFRNSTITANSAGSSSFGGGISSILGPGNIQIESTIVAGNTNSGAPDIFTGGTVNAKFSAIGSKTGINTWAADSTTNGLLGADLKLGPLTDNGGPNLPTHRPATDSPLVNKGSNPAGLAHDERGDFYRRAPARGVGNGGARAEHNFVRPNGKHPGAA